MEVQTNSPQIRQARRDIVELLLDNHPMDCQTCDRDGQCELQKQAYRLGIRERRSRASASSYPVDDSSARWCAPPRSASSAAAACGSARRSRACTTSASTAAASRPWWAPPTWRTWTSPPASCAASASTSAPPPPSWRRTTPSGSGRPCPCPGDQAHRGAAGALHPRRHRRVLRHAHRHAGHRQARHGPAPPGLRRGVRHQLRRRPHHHRGGQRVPAPARAAAARCRCSPPAPRAG